MCKTFPTGAPALKMHLSSISCGFVKGAHTLTILPSEQIVSLIVVLKQLFKIVVHIDKFGRCFDLQSGKNHRTDGL